MKKKKYGETSLVTGVSFFLVLLWHWLWSLVFWISDALWGFNPSEVSHEPSATIEAVTPTGLGTSKGGHGMFALNNRCSPPPGEVGFSCFSCTPPGRMMPRINPPSISFRHVVHR